MARLKGFEKLTNVDDALQSFFRQLEPKTLDSERIPINEALGRVTAEDIRAKYDLPPFDRSAVDGYALRAKDTFGVSAFKTKTFKLTSGKVRENEAKELWTGNPIPEGADAVVMLEYTRKSEDKIDVEKSVTPGRNVSKRGEDVAEGDVAIKPRTRLNPHHLGLLAALGETHVSVILKPKVAILATGNELVELGNKLEPGKIVETNRLVFSNMCKELGAEALDLGLAKDDLKEISVKIREGLEQADAVITTGGTSVGYPDLVPLAVNQLGKPGVVIHGVAIRPGMPTALAILEGKPVFVLSGNPVAATVGFELFARPTLLKLLGIKEARPAVEAKLTRRVAGVLGRRVFLRVRVLERNGGFFAEPVRVTGSGVLTTMTKANGYVIIPENREGVEDGESVRVHLFSSIMGE
ncbi:MAG TPA: molybdopterin molybdenumtransferase MoeA [Candidatus Bathyarchaeota archaeon]|nr:molybdopterin molybdenumtransferase MoeA [Candidatus Bathyarchaeota archaeon]